MDNLRLITKYGYKKTLLLILILIFSFVFDFYFWFFLILTICSVFIFRNPERLAASDDEMAILSPADGVVSFIGKEFYMDKEFIKIEISNSVFDCGIIRSPLKLKFDKIKFRKGIANFSKESTKFLNSRVFMSANSQNIILRVFSGGLSDKIFYENSVNFQRCQRIGFVYDGIVEMFLPIDSTIRVSSGDKIYASNLVGFLGGSNAKK